MPLFAILVLLNYTPRQLLCLLWPSGNRQPDLNLPRTILWITRLIWSSALVNK